MLAIVPFFAWLALSWLVFQRTTRAVTLRDALLVGATLAAAWLVLGIELLSAFAAIHRTSLVTWWGVLLAACAIGAGIYPRERWRKRLPSIPRVRVVDALILTAITVLLGWALCQAWFSPPNNIDSQEYHLTRQVYWMQQQSVDHFPTSSLRQVAMPPLTEFAGLTLMVLSGGDRYHNLVQWCALGLAALAVSLIVRRFRRDLTGQLLAALWVVTIPLAFMQASTTKNDVVVLLFACLLAYWILLLATRTRIRWALIALIGLGFGALALTKGTGILFGLPLGATTAYYLLRYHMRAAVPALLAIGALALAINAGHFGRNHKAFGTIRGDNPGVHDGPTLGSDDRSLRGFVSTLARNIGPHLVTPSQPWNERLIVAQKRFHAWLGRDIDDPKTTWMPGGRFRPYKWEQHDEDRAAAPAHFYLSLLLVVGVIARWRHIPREPTLVLCFVTLAGMALFSYLLKWQYWHVRLVIVLPALLAPVFAWCATARGLRWSTWPAAALLVAAVVPSLNSLQRPLLGPKNIFVTDPLVLRWYLNPTRAPELRALADAAVMLKPKLVGFSTGASAPDYLLQRQLLDKLGPDVRFTAFNAKLQIPNRPEKDPDVLFVSRYGRKRIQHENTGAWYVEQIRLGRYALFLPERPKPSTAVGMQ